ncbi:MAG: C39 family peptidase [Peptococcaceae bacterium]|nr:C39 family peptidase [Peptococcaceae bacterium]
MKKRILSVVLVFMLTISMAAGVNAAPGDISGLTYEQVAGGAVLKAFTLVGSFSSSMINNIALNENVSAYLWDSSAGEYKAVAFSGEAVIGNFVELRDINGDRKADGALIVSWQDSEDYWDSGQHWDMDEFDDDGAFSDGQEWRIPFGQRLLDGYGIGGALEDFSNILDYADLENSTYWPLHDYYNAPSSETLTMLTGFRTTQQATGWACGPTSAIMVMDWFGLRGDLNEEDLAALRQKTAQGGATNLQQMVNIFEGLNVLHEAGAGEWGEWEILSSYDIVEEYDITKPAGGKYNLMSVDELMDGTMIREWLAAGKPILIGWNSFGGHWQVIIGYDDMGTEDTKDDVLILADPYDTTDHRNDGYNIQSLERFVYDWSAGFDTDFRHGIFVVASPKGWEETYEPIMGEGIVDYREGYDGDESDSMKLNYGRTAADISKYYPTTPWRGDNGLAGAATGGYERTPEEYINTSPYYAHYDYFGMKSGVSPVSGGELVILENFKTQQQTTEWTCGLTSALMAIEWFNGNPSQPKLLQAFSDEDLQAVADTYDLDLMDLRDDRLTEINLAQLRGEGRTNPGATTLNDMKNVFDSLNADVDYLKAVAKANQWDTVWEWAYLTTDNLRSGYLLDEDGERHYLEDGLADEGVIPYFLSLGYPVLIGWDEWGGHWQVAIGYDDMGTEDTQDDVLILADPYDTTDQNQDGYYLEAFERLVFGWGAAFDARRSNVFLIPYLVDSEILVNMYGKPAPDIVITAISPGNGQVNLDFAIKSANGKGYTLYLSEQSKSGVFKAYSDVNYNAKGAHIKGLTNGKTYYAYIEYKEPGGETLTSSVFSIVASK